MQVLHLEWLSLTFKTTFVGLLHHWPWCQGMLGIGVQQDLKGTRFGKTGIQVDAKYPRAHIFHYLTCPSRLALIGRTDAFYVNDISSSCLLEGSPASTFEDHCMGTKPGTLTKWYYEVGEWGKLLQRNANTWWVSRLRVLPSATSTFMVPAVSPHTLQCIYPSLSWSQEVQSFEEAGLLLKTSQSIVILQPEFASLWLYLQPKLAIALKCPSQCWWDHCVNPPDFPQWKICMIQKVGNPFWWLFSSSEFDSTSNYLQKSYTSAVSGSDTEHHKIHTNSSAYYHYICERTGTSFSVSFLSLFLVTWICKQSIHLPPTRSKCKFWARRCSLLFLMKRY